MSLLPISEPQLLREISVGLRVYDRNDPVKTIGTLYHYHQTDQPALYRSFYQSLNSVRILSTNGPQQIDRDELLRDWEVTQSAVMQAAHDIFGLIFINNEERTVAIRHYGPPSVQLWLYRNPLQIHIIEPNSETICDDLIPGDDIYIDLRSSCTNPIFRQIPIIWPSSNQSKQKRFLDINSDDDVRFSRSRMEKSEMAHPRLKDLYQH